jgi:hypothetical protein
MSDRLTDREMLALLDHLADQPLDADDVVEMLPLINEIAGRYRELLRTTIKLPAHRPNAGMGGMVERLASFRGEAWAISYTAKVMTSIRRKGVTKGSKGKVKDVTVSERAVKEAHRRYMRDKRRATAGDT